MLIIGLLFWGCTPNLPYLLPGLLGGPNYSLSDLTCYIYLFHWGFFGMVAEIAATLIIVFLIFGSFLQVAGAGKFFTNFALGLAGHFRGGRAKVAIMSSALFGMISGSPVANVGTVGTMTIPMMKKIGYKPYFAAAVESVASDRRGYYAARMGAVAFIMAQYTKMGYGKICIAASVRQFSIFSVCFFK